MLRQDPLTVDELVNRSGLQLAVVGGNTGISAQIETLYIGDLENPLRWMTSGSLLLTTGRVFLDNPAVGVRMLHELHEQGMPGMCVAITPYIESIDPAMIHAADDLGLALVEVPEETPFRRISEYVHDILASRDLRRLRRSLAQQNQLLESLHAGGRADLLRRLSRLMDGPSVLFDPTGNVIARAAGDGEVDVGHLWSAYADLVQRGISRSLFDWEGRIVFFREVKRSGSVSEVLMALRRQEQGMEELPQAAVSFAHRLLELELHTEESVLGVHRTEREDLLRALMTDGWSAGDVALRLGRQRMVHSDRWYALVLAGNPDADRPVAALPAAALRSVVAQLEHERIPFLMLSDDGIFAVLLEADPATSHQVVRRLSLGSFAPATGGGRVRIGAAGPTRNAHDVRAVVTRALISARLGPHSPESYVEAWFDDLGSHTRILAELSDDVLALHADAVREPLQTADSKSGSELLLTLQQYVIHDCSTTEAADALYLHRNALRKRLVKIEALTRLDLSRAEGIAEAYSALIACAILDVRQHLLPS